MSNVASDYSKSTKSALAATRSVPRRGLSRVEAAMYIGISPSKFDELRKAGRIGPGETDRHPQGVYDRAAGRLYRHPPRREPGCGRRLDPFRMSKIG